MTTTYGDLLGRAEVDVHTGLLHLMRRGFVDRRQAENTVGAYYDLIAALRSHTWWLIGPARVRAAVLARAGRRPLADNDLDMVAAAVFAGYGPRAIGIEGCENLGKGVSILLPMAWSGRVRACGS